MDMRKNTFGLINDVFDTVQTILIYWFGGMPFLWNITSNIMIYIGVDPSYEIIRSLIFVFLAQLYSVIISIPFILYSNFVIEEKFGFNKLTLSLFIIDTLKSIGLSIVIGAPVLSAVLFVIDWGGEDFWFYVWLLVFAVSLLMLTIYPTLIAPLFNKFEPLKDEGREGELKEKIVLLAERVKFPFTKIFVVDGSMRSAHSNAYFYGFFKNKRIVLYDTLLKQVDNDEIVAILGHELGHWKFNHVFKSLFITEIYLLVFFYLFGQYISNVDIYRAFGFDTKPKIIGLALFSTLYEPIEHVFGLAMNYLSRAHEYQADAFAHELGYDLTAPLTKLHKENLGTMDPDPLYSTYHHTHPTLVERIRYISYLKEKDTKKHS